MLKNNKINFILTKNLKSQNCRNYINVMYYHIGKLIDNGELEIK